MDKIETANLKLLGYSLKWVEYGFLTRDFLLDQAARFHTGEDQNTEHYRYAAFKEFQKRNAFSDREFEQYIELAALDPDMAMGTAALVDILNHPGMTEAQWEAVMAHPASRLCRNWSKRSGCSKNCAPQQYWKRPCGEPWRQAIASCRGPC
jgi:hypothetical protein